MKRILLLSILCLVLISSTAFAGNFTLDKTQVVLGGDTQSRSNDDEDYYERKSDTFSITNTGTGSLGNVTITSNANSKYEVNLTANVPYVKVSNGIRLSNALAATAQITVNGKITDDIDGVDSNNVVNPVSVGSISVVADHSASQAVNLKMQAENQLEINRVYIYVNDGSENSYNDGDDVKDLKPGDVLTVRVELKNKFSTNAREDFDIESEVEIDSLETGDFDFDENNLDFGGISASEKSSEETTLDIDEDIDDDTYTVRFTATGVDDNGARHGETIEIDFKVVREKYDIAIKKLTLEPTTIDNCYDRTVDLKVDIKNIGRSNDDQIVLKVAAPNLQYSKKIEDIDLDKDDDETNIFRIPVDEDTAAGNYFIEVSTYYNDDEPSNNEDITLVVINCPTKKPAEPEAPPVVEEKPPVKDDTEVIVIGGNTDEVADTTLPIIAGTQLVASVENSGFSSSKFYVAILAAAIIIAVGSLVMTIILVSRQKKTE
ncbi:MAG: hypothetical protein ABIC04_07920 [Nanoarchaeota archaeon]